MTCSYKLPCYPGNCHNFDKCTCEHGFKSLNRADGCLSFDDSLEEMYPTIGRSTATLADIRRSDNRVNFMFVLDGTNRTETETIWSNQKRFNTLEFQFESLFPPPDNLPMRPNYVHTSGFGITHSQITVNVSKISRSGSPIRDPGSVEIYQCNNGASDELPHTDVSNCTIMDDQFKTLIEHGDWLNVKFQAKNGGFRKLTNTDNGNRPYRTNHYRGLLDIKTVEFRFDFIAPKFCKEEGAFDSCPASPSMLKVQKEFTKVAIKPKWSGWTDDISGMSEYNLEIFRLTPDPYDRLIEAEPLNPNFSAIVQHSSKIMYPEYTPELPGIYSVLLTACDEANNSRIARRFALYDPLSNISLNEAKDGKLYVSSADEENGYNWQTKVENDGYTSFVVNWNNHFVNRIHHKGKFLNKILAYPIQFQDIEDDGILSSRKFVSEDLDDYEGRLTREGVKNFYGIVKFEIARIYTLDTNEPLTGWENIIPLQETYTFKDKLQDGQGVRIWVKAYDVMENTMVDFTYVRVDRSKPVMTTKNSTDTKIQVNYKGGSYNYTTRVTFKALDTESGVHRIGYSIVMHSPGKTAQLLYNSSEPANMKPDDGFCTSIDDTCYLPEQTLDLDNCWFMVPKKDLDVSSATLTVTSYNRAMLSESVEFEIQQINVLLGLEKYSGPENFRIEKTTSAGFRIRWDLPEGASCYGRGEIVLVIFYAENGKNQSETFVVSSSSTFFDILGRTPDTNYQISLGMRIVGGSTLSDGTQLAVRTAQPESDASSGVPGGVVAGVIVGLFALVALGLVVFVVLLRRGHFQPVRRGLTRAKTVVTRRARETFYGARSSLGGVNNYAYSYASDGDDLYVYGAMDFSTPQSWHIRRSDIAFESIIKEGHFAIYKATLKQDRKSHKTVVAKTLKEGFKENDEILMKAKINFTATVVGSHPNVLKFMGAVVDDPEVGPMIIYEYCEQGTLKEYLQSLKSNVTLEVQEHLFRYGLDIAKGMEYLASKEIVHRRLAARNILLTFLNDVKIAGFGPQPVNGTDDDGDVESGKPERIPIKWMGPECMSSTKDATEKSDVWSYAVVLWEIFSLGATPYEKIRSRDLPGRIKKGERLPKPEYCDDTWFGVMTQCWAHEPNKRSTFSDVRNQLDGLFVAAPGDDYYYYKR